MTHDEYKKIFRIPHHSIARLHVNDNEHVVKVMYHVALSQALRDDPLVVWVIDRLLSGLSVWPYPTPEGWSRVTQHLEIHLDNDNVDLDYPVTFLDMEFYAIVVFTKEANDESI